MKTITTNVYQFNELSEDAKEKAIERFRTFAWEDTSFQWECLREDASENADFTLTEVSDNPIYAKGSFKVDAKTTGERVLSNCGESCDIYSVAKTFMHAWDSLQKQLLLADDDDCDTLESEIEDLESEFETDIAHEFAKMWAKELEYAVSDEAIIETIEMNGYDFDAEGNFPARLAA